MNNDKRKAVDVIIKQPSIKFPWNVARFFVEGSRQINFAGNDASFGEDFGSIDELRIAISWFVEQLGGTVKWNKDGNERKNHR